MKAELFADVECWEFKARFPEEFDSYGCGPGGLGDILVPDVIPFVTFPFGQINIRSACKPHDWGYRHSGPSNEDERARHDMVFANNAKRIVDYEITRLKWPFRNSPKWKLRCYERINFYYEMIRKHGSGAYWEERNKPENMGTI